MSRPTSKSDSRLILFETRVARRMLGLFLLCALLPTVLLAVIGYRHVSAQLFRQSQVQLRDNSKGTGMAIIERLQMSEEELRTVVAGPVPPTRIESSRFKAIILLRAGRPSIRLKGSMADSNPRITSRQEEHLQRGGSVVLTPPTGATGVLMGRSIQLDNGDQGTIWGELDQAQLWGPAQDEGARISLCVLGEAGQILTCPPETMAGISGRLETPGQSGNSEWANGEETYLAGYWTAFLGFQWGSPSWTVWLSQPESSVLAPMRDFKRTFLMVIGLTLVLVFLLSNVQIRRRMEPLTRLQQGTQRVAVGNFSEPVEVASGDEFEHLAISFNSMAYRLGRQFNTLSVINDIGRAALSEVRTGRVVSTALSRIGEILPRAEVSLLLGTGVADEWRATTGTATCDIRAPLAQWLRDEPEAHVVLGGAQAQVFRPCFRGLTDSSSLLLLPFKDHEEIAGVIAIAGPAGVGVTSDDISQTRQIADQLAVAIANSRLVERLDQLSWGTLSALARTIDANSPWTAGHSERVTLISLEIGKELGLSAKNLDLIHRGSLLHDIGKIGIPPALLDKPGKLTDEEMEIIKSHPVVGSRILAPISVFQDIIPIVRHHHEKFDGTGYPDRLVGRDIPYLARIVAVADVYDALVSDRPYRAGWTREAAVELIQKTASSHHDPDLVAAFVSALSNGRLDQATLPVIGQAADRELILAGAAA